MENAEHNEETFILDNGSTVLCAVATHGVALQYELNL